MKRAVTTRSQPQPRKQAAARGPPASHPRREPRVREGLKWKAPLFRTTDDFATTNVHARDRLKIDDPTGLLEWRGKDRCLVTIGDARDFAAKRAALAAIVRPWIRQL